MFGRSAFPSVFDNDPFFRDPFAHMESIMNSMFHDPFMGGHQPFGRQVQAPQRQSSAPVIEEVDADEEARHVPRRGNNQPIVEEPDEDGQSDQRQHQRQRRTSPVRNRSSGLSVSVGPSGIPQVQSFGNNGGAVFSFSSSSYTSNTGPGGVKYTATSTTKIGPGGVRETQQTVRDGRTGQESIVISRGLGSKERTVTRTRDAQGRERTEDSLKGVAPEQVNVFDEEWRQEAERNFGAMGLLGNRSTRQPSVPQQYALPSTQTHGGQPLYNAQPILSAPQPTSRRSGYSDHSRTASGRTSNHGSSSRQNRH